jgi:predicted ATPase/DNA-binding CsgD family transcriptional regulator
VELLERDWALTLLVEARQSARQGRGRVAVVTGEPGIGKTWLVKRFLEDVGDDGTILFGTCDDLTIPRPLGPIRDLAGSVSPALATALSRGAAPHDIQALLIEELEIQPPPTVLVIEDVHWADDATLDLITVLGRRIGSLPALVVLTFRAGEAPPGHRLHATVGAIRAEDTVVVELPPLSQRAVTALAGHGADKVYAATGGNPFYVTEMLAARDAVELPPSVANAVLGRASRLDEASRHLVELVAIVPSRVSTSLLDAVLPDWAKAAEEPERRQLLEVDPAYVRFRHELARHAIEASIPIAAQRRLHAEILAALLNAHGDPSDIVHHAESAGAVDVVADYALVAARRAAALESNREAYFHYRRAAAFVHRRSLAEQATVLEELSIAAYVVNRIDEAFAPLERAIEINRDLDQGLAVGRCKRVLSRIHWLAGNGEDAKTAALESIAVLEPLGESGQLAYAYSSMSQLTMLADEVEQSLLWGTRALDLATRLGDEVTRAHALVNVGAARMLIDADVIEELLEAHDTAHAAGDPHEATRALINLGYTLICFARPESALHYTHQALAYAIDHEVHNLASYASTMLAWLRLRAGEWDEAERLVRAEVDRAATILQLSAKTVLTELAVRRGDADAAERLADLAEQANHTREPQRISPVVELMTEFAITGGTRVPVEEIKVLTDRIRADESLTIWRLRITAWAAFAGIDVGLKIPPAGPFGAMANREWRAAADRFGAVGWRYDRALMLSMLDDEASLVEAIEITRGLGAEPLTKFIARRIREIGFRVPAGQRETTRSNAAGLTTRQLEVLSLVAAGLTNVEIAERLVVSQRTAEHHVAAVLTKLGVATRRDAARRASELGLVAGRG